MASGLSYQTECTLKSAPWLQKGVKEKSRANESFDRKIKELSWYFCQSFESIFKQGHGGFCPSPLTCGSPSERTSLWPWGTIKGQTKNVNISSYFNGSGVTGRALPLSLSAHQLDLLIWDLQHNKERHIDQKHCQSLLVGQEVHILKRMLTLHCMWMIHHMAYLQVMFNNVNEWSHQ